MAKFCTKCGKPLKDGVPCTCSNNQKEIEEVKDTNLSTSLVDILKNILLKPADIMKQYSKKEYFLLAMILSLANVVLFGFFYYFLSCNVAYQQNTIASRFSYYNFFSTFFVGAFLMAACVTLLMLAIKLFVGIAFKNKRPWKEYFAIHGVCSVIPSATMIVGIILSFLSYKLAMIIFLLGILLYFVITVYAYVRECKVNENRLPYALPLAIVSTFIVMIIVCFIVVMIFLASYIGNSWY